jgi:hypothetical protein
MNKTVRLGLSMACLLCLASGPILAARPDDPYFSTDDVVGSRTIGEWAGAWWQWTWSLIDGDGSEGRPVHPLLDPTGQWAGVGQSGPVYFLGGSFIPGVYYRTVTVPRGKYLFFPLINQSVDNYICGVFDPKISINDMRQMAEYYQNDPQSLILEIDGQAVENPKRFRVTSPVYSVFLSQGALCTPTAATFTWDAGVPGEYMQQIADGYYVMLKPFSPGHHTVRLGGTSADGGFFLDVTYDITVE